ncbi:MAG: aspartate aminotransferase family protein [Thermoleophilia bacterium]|nr:aspartate aminotransferase family protein [Thermoleophilia bacterium]
MATVDTATLQEMAMKHLWLHFTQMAGFDPDKHPVMVRGDNIFLEDSNGNRYMDFLSGLFTVQIGYSHGEEIGTAMLEQAMELPYYTNWTYSHPKAIELATKLAEITPDSLNRAFFVSGGSEGVEGAIKLAREYHNAGGEPMRRKVIARKIAYHGTTYGALSLTGITSIRTPFEPLMAGVRHVEPTNPYRCKYCADQGGCNLKCADEVAEVIEFEDPSTVSMVIMEPVQNAGGCFTPHPEYHQRVSEICKEYGVLHAADETICGYGRLGEWFGAQRYEYEPDIITCAKGLTSGYQPMGAVLFGDRIADRLIETEHMFLHGITFGGHPIVAAAALKNLEIMEREGVIENVRQNEPYLRDQLLGLKERHEIIGDVRGAGYFWAMELVKDRATKETFNDEECNVLLRDFLSPTLLSEGLLCRADDRGDPAIQISPPLITTRDQIDEAIAVFDKVLPQAQDLMLKMRR